MDKTKSNIALILTYADDTCGYVSSQLASFAAACTHPERHPSEPLNRPTVDHAKRWANRERMNMRLAKNPLQHDNCREAAHVFDVLASKLYSLAGSENPFKRLSEHYADDVLILARAVATSHVETDVSAALRFHRRMGGKDLHGYFGGPAFALWCDSDTGEIEDLHNLREQAHEYLDGLECSEPLES